MSEVKPFSERMQDAFDISKEKYPVLPLDTFKIQSIIIRGTNELSSPKYCLKKGLKSWKKYLILPTTGKLDRTIFLFWKKRSYKNRITKNVNSDKTIIITITLNVNNIDSILIIPEFTGVILICTPLRAS